MSAELLLPAVYQLDAVRLVRALWQLSTEEHSCNTQLRATIVTATNVAFSSILERMCGQQRLFSAPAALCVSCTSKREKWHAYIGRAAGAGTLALRRCMANSAPHLQVAESLYSLHRGAMLGQVVGHADECAQLFHLFLKADLPLARAILVPRAYQVGPSCHTTPCHASTQYPGLQSLASARTCMNLYDYRGYGRRVSVSGHAGQRANAFLLNFLVLV